uniref:Uncharacterized protein n=1 Tax=Cylindrotheca closterium TaxID=2856 RepID=A0A023HC93_9STRA|nr:hypothetical protein [Cylindrotheca closterium]YP_009029152.1 hypothetical protein [Cylindrotheca closterium]AGH28622.1 hypothetical protein [Cylindrotheca closterium]AGH28683.1 hypothetical protein [Cylindrotheca closterium]
MVKSDILRFYVGVLVMFLTYRLVFSLVFNTLETAEQIALQEKQANDRKSTRSTDYKIISNNLRGGQGKAVTWFIRKVVPGVYKRAMQIAVSSGVVVTLSVMRGIASYDWWATYISYGLVNLTEEDRIILASLRRMRLGLPIGIVCISVTTELQLMLYNGDFKEAIDEWMVLLTRYDKLSEADPKKMVSLPVLCCL